MSQLTLSNLLQLPPHIEYGNGLNTYIEYNLSNSCAHALNLKELLSLSKQNLEELTLTYAPISGDPFLRKAIAHFHRGLNHLPHIELNYAFDETNVLTFCGAQEALAAVYKSILLPGDEVVVFTPCYPSLLSMAEAMGAQVKCIALNQHHQWQIHYQELEAAVNEKTKLIVINSPHNPTGSYCNTETAKKITLLAQKYQCYLLADDVAQASNYNNLPLAHDYLRYANSIVISVMSKSFGLSGVRVGWALSPNKALLKKMQAIKSFGSICCSAVDEKLALIALENAKEILAANNQIIAENIVHFERFINKNSKHFSWHVPQAGILAVVESKVEQAIDDWLPLLAQQSNIMLLPAYLFGLKGEYFRLGLGQKDFPQALTAFQAFIDNNF